jgi:predicted dinucleotide-binding enzyme
MKPTFPAGYARSNDNLKKLARNAQGNARAGTPGEAAKNADALLLAVHWSRIDDVLKQAGDLTGKVIFGCAGDCDSTYAASRKLEHHGELLH